MGVKLGCGSQDGGIDSIMTDEWIEEEMLADKMRMRLHILKMLAILHPGITVAEGNELFKGMSESALLDYIDLMIKVRRQLRGEV